MTVELIALCIDANDPAGLARFWAELLQWEIGETEPDEVALQPTDSTEFGLLFLRVPETKTAKNPIHLDLTTSSIDDRDELVRTAIALGAGHVDVGQTPADDHVVLADPEGNEFCVIEPANQFLAGCGRLGSITCDGSPTVGYFWSEALGWPLVWDQDDETAIRARVGTGPLITWGPPVPVKTSKNRLHLDVAAAIGADRDTEIDRLLALGATRTDIGQGDVSWDVMADPDGNEFCVLRRRDEGASSR